MSIPMDTQCIQCFLRRNLELVRPLGDEAKSTAFARELMHLMLSQPESAPSPYLGPGVSELLNRMYGLPIDRFREEKLQSNRFVLERLDAIRETVRSARDPVLAGLQMAILGNYLDFSALQGKVSFGELENMLRSALEMELDADTYRRLRRDLEQAKTLLYLTDNAGEIGFDRVLAEELTRVYPRLSITFCVRGGIAANDATREDAAAVGIPFPVIDSGSTIAGTPLDRLGAEADRAIRESDVILAKGMANTETMLGCGHNVYYAFLVKCPRFVERFGKPMLTPILASERAEG